MGETIVPLPRARRNGAGLPRQLVAKTAIEKFAESFSPAFGIEDPRAQLERRLVAHVPMVAARELGDPLALLVLVVADDRTLHATSVCPE
ncbi:MAG TPA: hypothetical protein VKG23_19690 [Thermoanaerobaculia bacterium]|nr:hypothetical protein [Thermoanaerobaculia bacterium]